MGNGQEATCGLRLSPANNILSPPSVTTGIKLPPPMPAIAIYNPVCGDGTAQSFFEDHVLPLLSKHGKNVDKCVPTMYKGHAGQLVLGFVEEKVTGQAEADITIIWA